MICQNCDCKKIKKFESSFSDGIPYIETRLTPTKFLREFKSSVNPNWLKWHWDEEDREVTVISDTDWKFQFDNELPFKLYDGLTFKIPAGKYHRIISGNQDLTIEIIK